MAWSGPSTDKPVWCADTARSGGANSYGPNGERVPTAQSVTCTTTNPRGSEQNYAMLQQLSVTPRGLSSQNQGSGTNLQPHPTSGGGQTVSDVPPMGIIEPASYQPFTSQEALGKYLTAKYHIRTAHELSSCEVCHR
jgi:hypothetical protein